MAVGRERWSHAQVGLHQRPRVPPVAGVEHDLWSLPGVGGGVVGPGMGVLRLAQVDRRGRRAALDPVPHRRVLRVQPDALRRELALDQAFQGDLGTRVGQPGLRDNGLASDDLADQAGRVDRGGLGRPARHPGQVRLGGVEDPDEAHHARVIVSGDVAVVQEVARGLLAAAGPALGFQVVGLARLDRLRVEPDRVLGDRRELLQPARDVGVGGPGVADPADAAAVLMEDVAHLRAGVDQADLVGVAHVEIRLRRGHVAVGVRAVVLRLIRDEAGVLLGDLALVEALAAVVDRLAARPVGVGELVHHGQLATSRGDPGRRLDFTLGGVAGDAGLLVDLPVPFVADLVEEQRELAEAGTGRHLDGRVPAALQRSVVVVAGPATATRAARR